jgi:putative ABC transport system permease protein
MLSAFTRGIKRLSFSARDSVYQVVIVAILSATVTGILLTGYSVRNSLIKTSAAKLGNTDILVSSGYRYFNASLAGKIAVVTGNPAVSVLESDGYCQAFSSGMSALNIKIYGVGDDFFSFNECKPLEIDSGNIAVNKQLAGFLGVKEGDEIILHFRDADPIPANAPFSPTKNQAGYSEKVVRIEKVLGWNQAGNFSTQLSQVVPMNVFVNLKSFDRSDGPKANRILIRNPKGLRAEDYLKVISANLEATDIGLSARTSEKSGETELISTRIFIDSLTVSEVRKKVPSASPVITYLSNTIADGERSAPYSFVSAVDDEKLGGIPENGIIINRWLADDIKGKNGDTIKLTWYDPGFKRNFSEKQGQFIIYRVIENNDLLCDPSYMPDFPGISGKTSCSGWDAGIPLLLKRISEKDEEYWKKFRGTPKAFITYAKGKEIWANRFGSATSLRFPEAINPGELMQKLRGSFDASKSGFTVTDIRSSHKNAAETGVDFSLLFFGLGIFLLVSCLILLVISARLFFESRKEYVKIHFFLGFTNRYILSRMTADSALITMAGALAGSLIAYPLNCLIISQLNSVWSGAVQTNSLTPYFSFGSVAAGFVSTILISLSVILIMVRSYQVKLSGQSENYRAPASGKVLIYLIISVLSAFSLFILSRFFAEASLVLSFISGISVFVSFILLLLYLIRHYGITDNERPGKLLNFSEKYYSFHPQRALTPAIFVAAGIFAIIITGANKLSVGPGDLLPESGTGGYLLYAEAALPVRENLSAGTGRMAFGLEEPPLNGLIIDQSQRVSGDDASCLNLNHVTSPPLLGVDPDHFVSRGSFSFASGISAKTGTDLWTMLDKNPVPGVIYGIADQSVLEWGLKIKTGDTLKYLAESGENLDIIICAGLKPSVFQGKLLISNKNLQKYFPSVAGSSVFLIDGNRDSVKSYIELLSQRLSAYGFSVTKASDRLASFFTVTNTYLDVFMMLGIFGLIMGVAGLGFMLLRNINNRQKEYALMLASGYTIKKIRRIILLEYLFILLYGILSGVLSALAATFPSIKTGGIFPWSRLAWMVILLIIAGSSAIILALRRIRLRSLSESLRAD